MDLETSPFRRLREMTGLTKAEFTRRAAVARTTTVYIDAGLYITPKTAMLLIELCEEREIDWQGVLESEYGSKQLDIALVIWQRTVRKTHQLKLHEAWVGEFADRDPEDVFSPFDVLARAAFGTRDAFCKAMKVQVGAVYLYNDEKQTGRMPVILKTALLDGGLTPAQIGVLDEAMKEWRGARADAA